MHLIWFSAVVPPLVGTLLVFPVMRRREIWWVTTTIALIGLASWIGWDLYLLSHTRKDLTLGMSSVIFSLVRSTDIPIVALAIGSIVGLLLSRKTVAPESEETVVEKEVTEN